MTRLAAALLVLLTACGGGNDAAPRATGSPATVTPTATPTPDLPAEVRMIRAAAAKARAACPCDVELLVFASGKKHFSGRLVGTYDPAAETTVLRDPKTKGVEVRIVRDRTFLRVDADWLELDFAGLPAEPRSELAALLMADPRIGFAFADHVVFAVEHGTSAAGTRWESEFDVPAAIAATGPWAEPLERLGITPPLYDDVTLKQGRLTRVSLNLERTADELSFSQSLWITKTGVPAPRVTVPKVLRTLDVATAG